MLDAFPRLDSLLSDVGATGTLTMCPMGSRDSAFYTVGDPEGVPKASVRGARRGPIQTASLATEEACLRRATDLGLRVPRVLGRFRPQASRADDEVLVLEWLAGASAEEPAFFGPRGPLSVLSLPERMAWADSLLGQLAVLHASSLWKWPGSAGDSDLQSACATLQGLIADRCPDPALESALVSLGHVQPVQMERAVPLWGDARFSNTVWNSGVPVGLLDWELAASGPREMDLAWLAVSTCIFRLIARRLYGSELGELLTPHRLYASYAAYTEKRLHSIRWFERFAALRLSPSSRSIPSWPFVRGCCTAQGCRASAWCDIGERRGSRQHCAS